jgi:hypothetical protein
MSHLKPVSLALGLLLLLLSPARAHADTPRQPVSGNFSFTALPGFFLDPCSQPLSVVATGTLYYTKYYDQAGNLVRILITAPPLYTYTVTGPNGNSLTGRSPAPEHVVDVVGNTGILVNTGEIIRFTIPGTGSVFAEAGRQTFIVDLPTFNTVPLGFTGESEVNTADTVAYCGYLGAS